jgi:hypothetical protein
VELTTHLQLVPRSRKHESISLLPHKASRHSAQLVKHRGNFTFYHSWMVNVEHFAFSGSSASELRGHSYPSLS